MAKGIRASVVRIHLPPPVLCGGYRIMAITSAFQADDVGSIPTTRSKVIRCSYSSVGRAPPW